MGNEHLGRSVPAAAAGVYIVGIRWNSFDKESTQHAAIVFGAFFALMLVHDGLQEQVQIRLLATNSNFGLLLSLVEMLACVIGPLLSPDNPFVGDRRGSIQQYVALAAVVGSSVFLSNLCLKHVAYPIKVVGKSTKLVPAMMLSWCVLNKKYTGKDYVCALLLCFGLAGFTLAESQASGHVVSIIGVAMLAGACTADALAPSLQQRLMTTQSHRVPPTPTEVMAYTNLIGSAVIASVMVVNGQLGEASSTLSSDLSTLGLLIAMGATTFWGVSCYMLAVKQFSGVVVVAVSTGRKCVTVVLSFLFFSHEANRWHLLSGGILCSAIAFRTLGPNKKAESRPVSNEESTQPLVVVQANQGRDDGS